MHAKETLPPTSQLSNRARGKRFCWQKCRQSWCFDRSPGPLLCHGGCFCFCQSVWQWAAPTTWWQFNCWRRQYSNHHVRRKRKTYPLAMTNIATENYHLLWENLSPFSIDMLNYQRVYTTTIWVNLITASTNDLTIDDGECQVNHPLLWPRD